MAVFKNDILPASVYNSLPNIRDVFNVHEVNAADIADLKNLLMKHDLPDSVRIKLVHIHFLMQEGEVFATRDIMTPKHGSVAIMEPVIASQQQLYGYHFFVDDEGNLSAYEYMEEPGVDLSGHHDFIQEFCQLVRERGLQRKLGLSIRHGENSTSTQELEYAAKRMCIDVPYEIPMPYSEDSFHTMTEFFRDWPIDSEGREPRQHPTKSCGHYTHHKHTDRPHKHDDNDGLSDGGTASDDDSSDGEFMDGLYVRPGLSLGIELAGTKLDKSSDLYDVVACVVNRS